VGLKRVAEALDILHARIKAANVLTCLEITAGQGSSLGYRLEHLASIINEVKHPERLGVCLDTAHLFAAGYDFRGSKYKAFRKEVDQTIGLEGFRPIVRDEIFRNIPKILETPKSTDPDSGRPWDEINLQVLKELANKKK
jgi:deoxyribonuclease-4